MPGCMIGCLVAYIIFMEECPENKVFRVWAAEGILDHNKPFISNETVPGTSIKVYKDVLVCFI